MNQAITLSERERRTLVRLLGILQDHLESAIESNLIPGTNDVGEEDKAIVALDRKRWKEAETFVNKLTTRKTKAAGAAK